jgi:hypothetical protein
MSRIAPEEEMPSVQRKREDQFERDVAGALLQSIRNRNSDVILLIHSVFNAPTTKTLNSLLNTELETLCRINISSPSTSYLIALIFHQFVLFLTEMLFHTPRRFPLSLNPRKKPDEKFLSVLLFQAGEFGMAGADEGFEHAWADAWLTDFDPAVWMDSGYHEWGRERERRVGLYFL